MLHYVVLCFIFRRFILSMLSDKLTKPCFFLLIFKSLFFFVNVNKTFANQEKGKNVCETKKVEKH